MKWRWFSVISGVLFLCALLYGVGDLIANNAGFFTAPGAARRLGVYLSLSSAWTASDYPLPEVAPRDYLGDPALLRKDILLGIGHFDRWKLLADPGPGGSQAEVIRVRVPGSFWRSPQNMEIRMTPMQYGLHVWAQSSSIARRPDLGANRNSILRLFHAIDNQIALHPPG